MATRTPPQQPLVEPDRSELLAVDIPPAARHPKVRMITRTQIHPDPEQPRQQADAELRDSIARNGLLQPITVRPHPTIMTEFMIVDGERRWMSAEGVMNDLPCIVRNDMDELSRRLATQLEANTGKALTPLEEARAIARMMDDTGLSAGDIAEFLGRAKSTVAERVGLLELKPWLPLIERGDLVMSHAVKILLPLRGIPDQFQEKAAAEVAPFLEDRHDGGAELRVDDVRKMIHRAVKPFLYPLAKTKAYGAKSPEFNTSKHDVECGCGVVRVALGYDTERAYCGDPTWWKPKHNAAMRTKHPVSKGSTPASKSKSKELYLPAGTASLKASYGQTPAGAIRLTNQYAEWAPDPADPFDPADLELSALKLVQWTSTDGGYPSVGTKDTKAIEAARAKWRERFATEEHAAAEQFRRELTTLRKAVEITGAGVPALAGVFVDKMYDEELERVIRTAIAVGIEVPKAFRGPISYKQEDGVKNWVKGLSATDAAALLTAFVAVEAEKVKLPIDVVDALETKALANIRKRAVPWLTKPKEEKAPAPKKASARRAPTADFMKDMYPSAALAAVIGNKAMPRTEVTKKLWSYFKKHGSQDATNRRMINADDKLSVLFNGKAQVSMFELTKIVNKHLAGTAEAAALIYAGKKKPAAAPPAPEAELPDGPVCIHCGCSDDDACLLDGDETCYWVSKDPPVCSAPDCVSAQENGPAIVTRGDDLAESLELEQAEV